jgi:hypothetical protein
MERKWVMEIVKQRSVSHELSVMRSLNTRADLSEEEKKHNINLEKGYQGEVMFDQLTAELHNDILVINDLCLEFSNTIFQIDTLIISQKAIYLFEVKNYKDDYIYESDNFKLVLSKKEILNPLGQLNRCRNLLQDLLRSLHIQLPLEGYLVFINPEFTLYQAPLNEQIIFPTQLKRLMNTLIQRPSKLTDWHRKIGAQLVSMHLPKNPNSKIPPYEYDLLKKHILCSRCFSFMTYDGDWKVFCEKCDCEEHVDSAILRSVEELKLLFPDKKITTNLVYDWCGGIGSMKKYRRILKQNYKVVGDNKWTYFE